MKLYWRIKKNGKWTWKPARAYLFWTNERAYWKVPQLEEEE